MIIVNFRHNAWSAFFLVLSGVVFYYVKNSYPSGLCHSQRLALLESMSLPVKLFQLLANEGLSVLA